MDPFNKEIEEKKVGQKYARQYQASIRGNIQRETRKITGAMLRTTARAKISDGELQSIVITSPRHSFILHHGFEGVKSNGVHLALMGRGHLFTNREEMILSGLADDISNVRASEVIASINLHNGKQ